MEILKVLNLYKSFDGREALDDISFEVHEGEFLSILGPTGCGKTTLLRILIGLLEPDKGTVLLKGEDITHASPDKRSMGIVFQNYALFENMTVLKNVEYALRLRKDLKSKSREIALKMIEQVGLSEHVSKYPSQLSGGQQQRVAIARAVVAGPKLILADEPTGNLDSKNGKEVMDLLKELNAEGTTIVMVTHSQKDAAQAQRTIDLFDGQIVSDVKNEL